MKYVRLKVSKLREDEADIVLLALGMLGPADSPLTAAATGSIANKLFGEAHVAEATTRMIERIEERRNRK